MNSIPLTFALVLVDVLIGATALAKGERRPHAVTLCWVFGNSQACLTGLDSEVYGADYRKPVAAGDPNPALIQPNDAALCATGGTTEARTGEIGLTASIDLTRDPLLLLADPLRRKRGFTGTNPEGRSGSPGSGRLRRPTVLSN